MYSFDIISSIAGIDFNGVNDTAISAIDQYCPFRIIFNITLPAKMLLFKKNFMALAILSSLGVQSPCFINSLGSGGS